MRVVSPDSMCNGGPLTRPHNPSFPGCIWSVRKREPVSILSLLNVSEGADDPNVAVLNGGLLLPCRLWVQRGAGVVHAVGFWVDFSHRASWAAASRLWSWSLSWLLSMNPSVCVDFKGCGLKSFATLKTSQTAEDWVDLKESVERRKHRICMKMCKRSMFQKWSWY